MCPLCEARLKEIEGRSGSLQEIMNFWAGVKGDHEKISEFGENDWLHCAVIGLGSARRWLRFSYFRPDLTYRRRTVP